MKSKNLKKIETIEQRIQQLKAEQNKIEQDFATQLIAILKTKQALTLDFTTLVGGLLTVIHSIKANSPEIKDWQTIGEQFCGTKKLKKIPETVA